VTKRTQETVIELL